MFKLKRIILFFIVFLLSLNIIHALEDDWFFNSQSLIVNINVFSEAEINPTDSDYSVKYINVNLSHYPYEDFGQEVLDLDINKDVDIENNSMLFSWQNPGNKINFGYNTKIRTNSNVVQIKDKIKFPILDLPEELEEYTLPSEIINSDDEDIIGFASELAEGEDDLYVVVHKIAEWTKTNIEYDLSTLTAEVSQKASWVIDTRKGVCDELTSLFIAMLRSLGIPGKFVSGIAYTNSELFPENWGSHGWAEIYFPGHGWVPYDVTYGQFGYIDPTHIKLKESIDSNEPSVQYRWVARNIDLETGKLDIDTKLESTIGRTQDPVNLDIKILKQNIGYGSYNLVEGIIENTKDYYISSEVYISKPKEVKIIGEAFQNVLLKPNEKKSVFWLVKLTDDLERNFVYTFPVSMGTIRGSEVKSEFKSKKGDIDYSLAEVQNVLQQKQEEEEKTYSRDVEIDCNINDKEFYYYKNSLVKCNIKNIGNVVLKNLNICFESDCETLDLGIVQEKSFNYTVEKEVTGKQESIFKIKNSDVSKAEYIEYDVLDQPKIDITKVESPSDVEYNDIFKINFLLSKQSNSIPKNLEITLSQNNFKRTWTVNELSEDRKFIINLAGKDLKKDINEFNIVTKYEDGNGKPYESKEAFFVNLENVTLTQNILLTFNQLILFLTDLVS
jgi:transglutaminase-like putative cysteine protease